MDWPRISEQVREGASLPISPLERERFDIRGNPVTRPTGNVRLRSFSGPELDLPTGRVVVWDPSGLNSPDVRPLAISVAPGRYPTQFLQAEAPVQGRIAFAILWIKREPPYRAMPAPRIDQVRERLGPGEAFAIGTDSASLCFTDMQFCERVLALDDAETQLWTRADEAWNGKAVAELQVPGAGSAVMFASGFGDGVYSFVWGLDKSKSPVCLVVDLDVVQSEIIPRAYAQRRPRWRFW
jgi:hypothetical protein